MRVAIPAPGLRAADLPEHADFLSVGTDDLAQDTLAADRMAGELDGSIHGGRPCSTSYG